MRTLVSVVVAGGLGLLAVLETARYYRGVDSLAFAITVVMAAVFCGGILELIWVARRTRGLQVELDAFPADADYSRIEGATPLLRALLSARLDRTALPVPGPVFAPFIVGFLVMLGLLGTFLGLFETLRGAGYALEASADIEAMRAGLKAPISGLMRSFGTSAAGVASSAMLGLAAVLVRRDGSRFGVTLHSTASGSLAQFAPAHRQLVALETLAEQGRAWPTAAAALEQAVVRLDDLQQSWGSAHDKATSEIRAAIEQGVTQAAQRTGDAVSPLLQEAVRGNSQVVQEHLSQVRTELARDGEERATQAQARERQASEQLKALGTSLEQDRQARQQSDAAAVKALTEQLQALQSSLGEDRAVRQQADAAAVQALAKQLDGLRKEAEQEQAGRVEREQGLLARHEQVLSEQRESRRQSEESLLSSVREQLQGLGEVEQTRAEKAGEFHERLSAGLNTAQQTMLAQIREHAEQMRLQQEQLQQALAETEQTRVQTLVQQESERAQSLGELAARMQQDLAQAASMVRERLDHSAEAEAAQQRRAEKLFERLTEASGVIADSAKTQVGALGSFVETTDGRLRDAEQAAQQRLQQMLNDWGEQGRTQAQRLADFEQQLVGQHAQATERLGETLGEHADTLQQKLNDSAQLLQQASTLIHGGGTELSAVAESFSAAVASQREGARQWLEALGDIERYALESGEAAAADVLGQHLARTHEVFDRQLRFQQELMEQLHGPGGGGEGFLGKADASA